MPGEQVVIPQTVKEPESVNGGQPAADGKQSGAAAEGGTRAAVKLEQQGIQGCTEKEQCGIRAKLHPETGDAPQQFAAEQGTQQQDNGPDKPRRYAAALYLVTQVTEQPAPRQGRQVVDDDAGCYQKQVRNLPHYQVIPLGFMPGYQVCTEAQTQRGQHRNKHQQPAQTPLPGAEGAWCRARGNHIRCEGGFSWFGGWSHLMAFC